MASALWDLPRRVSSEQFFEDIIDGYFPLAHSLEHLMQRRGLHRAVIALSHAPVLRVQGLAIDAPVPLTIRAGQAGLVRRMVLSLAYSGPALTLKGYADWKWLDGATIEPSFDPLTRLAEPAFLQGISAIGHNIWLKNDPTAHIHSVRSPEMAQQLVDASHAIAPPVSSEIME